MHRHTRTCALAMISAAALILAGPSSVRAQVAGENVNMVTGTGWPGGDPFLQRQNEPSIAVSSANPQHLLAGANDYRSVDVPNSWNPGEKMAGDAWLGVFKSLDGGQTWKSYLLPGFALETPRTANSKLYVCGTDKLGKAVPCTSAADPIVRAGPDGMFYFGGIVFNRSAIPATAKGNYGKVFLTRYIDLNNKEDGNAALSASAATDPIRYVDQKEVALGGPDDFVDKPWVAIDIPRNTNTCKIVLPDAAKTTRTVAAHTVYVTYLRIVSGTQSDVMVRHSDDCGNSWSSAVKVSDGTSLANEGPSLAIDPVKGHVYVTWRRVGGLNPGQSDAIMLSRTFSHGNRFTRPRQVAVVKPFDQPTTAPTTDFPFQASFRVTLFPSSAISMDPTGVRRLHVAWSERADGTAYGNARVMVATKRLSPPPVSEYEPDEDDNTCQKLDAPRAADNRPVTADGEPLKFPMNGNLEFALGHQFMPSLTFSQGKLMLVYYDSRLDHARAYYTPHTTSCTDNAQTGQCVMPSGQSCPSDGSQACWTLNSDNSYYDVIRGPWGRPVVDADGFNGLETLTDPASQIFTGFLDEGTVGNIRHTVDVRLASALPGDAPDFNSAPLSKFPFGTRGDEGFIAGRHGGALRLPGYGTSEVSAYPDDAISLVETSASGKLTLQRLQQLKMNPPNLPLFRNGSTPFMGDYIDIQGPAFVKKNGKWAFNTDPTTSPVFHAVWTSNEDVRAPLNGDWSKYVPINANNGTTSVWNGGTRDACRPNTDDVFYSASRNQNIYTARITDGLVVTSPQNTKPLSPTLVRSFIIAATNTTAFPMTATFRFTAPAGVSASFQTSGQDQLDLNVSTVSAIIAPRSTVSRTLFVKSSSPTSTLTATVTESGGGSGFVTLNPPGLVPGVVTLPDSCVGPAAICSPPAGGGELYATIQVAANLSNANLSNANLSNANLSNANLSNANLSNANLSNANLSNANLSNAALANLSNANLSNANLSNANLSNANLSNANLSNANLSNANLSNANLSNAAVSDLNYEFQNNGTTSTSYAIKLVGTPPRQGEALQLILAKTYTTPAAVGCVVKEEPHNHIQASIDDVSGSVLDPNTAYVNPDVTVPSVTNATLSLAPGEKAQVTLRGRVTLARMAEIGAQLSPRLVPQGKPGGVTLYKDYFPRAGSTTTLQVGPATGHLQATVKDSATTAAVTVGTVTFVANGTLFIGTIRLDDPVNPPTTPGVAELVSDDVPTGATVVAYYSGSNAYLPSQGSSAVVTTSGWRQLAPMPTPRAAPAVAAPGSLIYALGGFDTNVGSTTPLALDTYSIRANSWTPQALQTWTMPPSGTVHAASVGGEMYFAYRASPLVLDVITRPTYMVVEKRNTGSGSVATSWSAYTTSFAMSSVAAVVPVGTNLYIFFEGRGSNTLGTSGPQMPVAIFDTLTGNFSLDTQGIPDPSGTAGVPSPVYLAAAADGDRIYIFGGAAFGTTVGSTAVWEYDTTRAAGSRFRAVEPMPSARWAHGAASLGGKIYVMGGTASQVRASTTTVDVFTPPSRTAEGATGTWTVGPAMTRPHSLPGVVVSPAENKFYVIGGLIEVNTSITMTNMNWTMLPINFVDEFTP